MTRLEISDELRTTDDQTIEISDELPTTDDQTIVKRKRTKRHRPSDHSLLTSSPTTSPEEDEDMANCLILLARGNSKFTETATTTTGGKIGIYVYECKTCNRAFSSFQALGGHRASHKKPKLLAAEIIAPTPNSTLLPFDKVICDINEQSKAKIHECSICGSEFGSGQALGGHMRRHRAPNEKPRSMLALDLDLNLPAPPEDDKFGHFSAAALVDCHY